MTSPRARTLKISLQQSLQARSCRSKSLLIFHFQLLGTASTLKMKLLILTTLLLHLSTSSPVYNQNLTPHPPPTSNRRVFEFLFSPNVNPASVVPKILSNFPFWVPHAYFNLCDTVDQTEDSLWAYGCSPNGPGPNSILPGANIPPPTYPYDEMDDKGVGVLVVPQPAIHPDIDYYAGFYMQQGLQNSNGGTGSTWFFNDMPQGFWG